MSARLTPEQRFMAKVDVQPYGGCWLWTGALINSGYGRFWYEGKTMLAHRVAYELFVGPIEPEDGDDDEETFWTIDHTCHDASCKKGVACPHRACVNPNHLNVVSQKVNVLRGDTISARNAVKTHCLNGHKFTPENTAHYIGPRGNTYRFCRRCDRERHTPPVRPKIRIRSAR